MNRKYASLLCCLLLVGCSAGELEIVPAPQASPAPKAAATPEWMWREANTLTVEGQGWTDTENWYERLPARAKDEVPGAVWWLSKHTAGICVRFVTDSNQIAATWDGGAAMNHMAATGNSGLDLYSKEKDGQWLFRGVGRPKPEQTTATLASNLGGEAREYLLYLPLYSKVTSLKIGVDCGSKCEPAEIRPIGKQKPIVFYGTSITQGGCASRAGMCHPAMLGRWLNREVINLGFSGAGKMEPALGDLVSELDACVFVLDCLPNMTPEMVAERVEPFVLKLRKAHPETPILLVENAISPLENRGNVALRKVWTRLNEANVPGLRYLRGELLLAGRENGTVDGVHPTDLGFYRMAKAFEPVLRDMLGE